MELKIKKATEMHILGSNVIMKTFSVIVRLRFVFFFIAVAVSVSLMKAKYFFPRMIEFFHVRPWFIHDGK